MDNEPEPNPTDVESSDFARLPLIPEVLLAVEAAGYEKPTAVQSQIIPLINDGRDVLAQSQTGTGKTGAFALPILSRIDVRRRETQVLVLAPTRELAIQVAASFQTYGKNLRRLSVATIYGGQDYEIQFRALKRGAQVVVGTPGRVIDHIKRETLALGNVDCVVLDEADEMLDMGFLEDVEFVLEQTAEHRQVALFSATLPPAILGIARKYLKEPQRISIKKKTMTADLIRHRALFVSAEGKIDVLSRLLEAEDTDGVIVFTRTREATVSVAEALSGRGWSADALNGDMPQKARERTIDKLKSGKLNILVATDVAARGLDVSRVSHVFNFDAPDDSKGYIHRVGRTGRAGKAGEAILFLSRSQRGKLRAIEKGTKQAIEVIDPPSAREINALRVGRFKKQIARVSLTQDLSLFEKLVTEHAEESETSLTTIAAALAQIAQGNEPFFAEDSRPTKPSWNNKADRKPQQRRSRPMNGKRHMDRYRIEVGRRDSVEPGNIVGALTNTDEVDLDGGDIGHIEIHDTYSTIELPKGMPTEIRLLLSKARVAGKQLRLTRAKDGAQRSSPRQWDRPQRAKGRAKPYKPKKHDRKKPPKAKKRRKQRRA